MVKDPETFKNANFNGQGTPLEMTLNFISKIFKDGREMADEIHSMCAVSLILALQEHLGDGLQVHLHTINQFYLDEMSSATTPNYKHMLIQGIMMNFWYDQQTNIASLSSLKALETVLDFILSQIKNMTKDFEIKRIIIGLSSLTLLPSSSNLDAVL